MIKTDMIIYFDANEQYSLSIFFIDGSMTSINIDKEQAEQLTTQGIKTFEIPF